MKSNLNFVVLLVILSFRCFLYSDNELDQYELMNEEVLFDNLRKTYIHDIDCKSQKAIKNEFMSRMDSEKLYPILESQIVKEVEHKIDQTTERNVREFQKFCILSLRLLKTDNAFDEMILVLERGSTLDDNDKTILLIKNIAFHKYVKAIPILEKLAFDKTSDIHPDIKIACLKSLSVIGKPGVDLLIKRFLKWEENNDSDEYKGELWPLSYSRDKRAQSLAYRYLSNKNKRNEALSVLSLIGAKIPQKMKEYLSETHLRTISLNGIDIPYNLFIGCDDLTKEEIVRIKNILLDELDDYNRDYSIRLISAENLRYYPYPDVITALKKSMDNDPYSLSGQYTVRERAKESLGFLEKYYPELFDKKANQDGFQAHFK